MQDLSEISVLVVDDTESNVDILVEALGDIYDVMVALDGETALEAVAEDPPRLILLDVMMPGLDGYEVCRRLKADPATAGIPVVFLSGHTAQAERDKGLALGAADFISKPIDPGAVDALVRRVLGLA
ncbi:MAG: response regulator [Deltaproteobacteria bacterium]|nr:response regulator [Deltaproteobacteria bacterium]